MEREIVAPGDSVRLTVIFYTSSYYSRVTKSPIIYTNADTLSGISLVNITTTVTPNPDSLSPIVVLPNRVDISQFGPAVRDSISCTLRNVTNSTLNLDLLATPNEFMNVEFPTQIGPLQEVDCVIKLTELGISSEFEKSITFETDNPVGTRYSIPVTRSIHDSVSIAPETTCVSNASAVDCP